MGTRSAAVILFIQASMLAACQGDGPCRSPGAVRVHGVCDCPEGTKINELTEACELVDAGMADEGRSSPAGDGSANRQPDASSSGPKDERDTTRLAEGGMRGDEGVERGEDGSAGETTKDRTSMVDASASCVASEEICDQRDNDCDGQVDESGVCRAITQLAVGDTQACAVRASGEVLCWAEGSSAKKVPELENVLEVRVGRAHACARTATDVKCWGHGTRGQLGDGEGTDSVSPVSVATLRNVAELALGGDTSCARHMDGRVSCWGFQMRFDASFSIEPREDFSRVPRDVTEITGARELDVGESHACAVLDTEEVICWGVQTIRNYGGTGALGRAPSDDTEDGVPSPVQNIRGAVQVAAGSHSTCALTKDARVHCWGSILAERNPERREQWEELDAVPKLSPGLIELPESIAVGGSTACALLRDGHVQCFGTYGLGAATVMRVDNAEQIALAASMGCARMGKETVSCWRRVSSSSDLGIAIEVPGFK